MKILQYIKSLLPDFEKRKLLEDIHSTKDELITANIPLYEQAYKIFSSNKFSSPLIKEFDALMKKNVYAYRHNHIFTILRAMKNSSQTLDMIIGHISEKEGKVIVRDGLSALMANMLQYSDISKMASAYARRWLLHVYTLESIHNYTASDYLKSNEFMIASTYFNKHQPNFFKAIEILSKTKKEVSDAFEKIPSMAIDPDGPLDPSITAGARRIDPLQFGLLPTVINPIYQLRMAYTDWVIYRHTLMVEEKQQIELKLLLLKQGRSGNKDPNLEQQIEYNEQRIEKLRYKIEKIEASVDE